MVLPRYKHAKYINFNEGAYFGVIDVIASVRSLDININDWSAFREKLLRKTSVMAFK